MNFENKNSCRKFSKVGQCYAKMEPEESPILFSPKEMMKSRRPHRFSDSPSSSEPQLSRTILEYHLDTLTSRNQETEFERFALAISKSAICPNLRPQTGPAGGGDGKVDTETFPVVESLTFSWYIGDEVARSASERWAFAFSAKKQWKGKLISDIEKIASTKRGYTKAFFISNQLISDRNSSKQQDELTEKYGMDVRILSRTWLLDQVFEKRLELVAIELLGIEVNALKPAKLGPNDSVRKERLSEIDREIEETVQQEKKTPDLVNASLESARLARELELPKIEVEGRYVRAERLAEECGTAQQKLEVAYQQAWTAYFWHEDFDQFYSFYRKLESLVQNSENPFHAERLSNLWHLAYTLERIEGGDSRGSDLSARTKVLVGKLNQISDSPNRPNSALYAKSLLWLQNVANRIDTERFYQIDIVKSPIFDRSRRTWPRFPTSIYENSTVRQGWKNMPDGVFCKNHYQKAIFISRTAKITTVEAKRCASRENRTLSLS